MHFTKHVTLKRSQMMKKILITLFLSLIYTGIFSQSQLDYINKEFEDFFTILKTGCRLGYWNLDSLKRLDTKTQAYLINKDYYLDRDTLIVKNKTDNESSTAHDFNFKAFIESDSIVSVKIYLPNILSDKRRKKLSKMDKSYKDKGLSILCKIQGEKFEVSFKGK